MVKMTLAAHILLNTKLCLFFYFDEPGHEDFIELLLNSGANINLADFYGDTSLHTAVNSGW